MLLNFNLMWGEFDPYIFTEAQPLLSSLYCIFLSLQESRKKYDIIIIGHKNIKTPTFHTCQDIM